METVFLGLAVAIALWLIAGVLMLCVTPVFIERGAPWSVRLTAAAMASYQLPAVFIMRGKLPAIIVESDDMDEAEKQRLADWQASICNCEVCQERRRG